MWNCPLPGHTDDDSPSFAAYDDQKFYCFGCGARGDVIDYVMMRLGVTLDEALEILSRANDMPRPEPASAKVKAYRPSRFEWGFEMLRAMNSREEARRYFDLRCIGEQTFADNLLGLWVEYPQFVKHQGQWLKVVQRRYVIPYLYDNQICMANLRLDDDWAYENLHRVPKPLREAHKGKEGPSLLYAIYGPKYKQEPIKTQSMPFGIRAFVRPTGSGVEYIHQPYALIVESEIDQMMLASMGYPSIAAKATSHPMIQRLPSILRHTDNVFVIADNDDAGRKYARDMVSMLHRGRIIAPPESYSDANAFAMASVNPQRAVGKWLAERSITPIL
jgi:DNA primase